MYQAIPTQPHSGLGIASFLISLGAGAILCIVIGIAGVLDTQPGRLDEDSVAAGLLGLAMVATGLAQTLALGLGIAALVQAGRNKLYGVLGTVFSATGLVGTTLLFLLGALMEG
jgi:hypothetical protein